MDLAIAVALGGDAAADIAVLRAQPGVFGPVASDPTVSRLITTLAAGRRRRRWPRSARLGRRRGNGSGPAAGAPVQDGRVVIDLDATPGHRALNWHWHRFLISGRAVSGQDVCSWRVATFKV